MLTVLPQPSSCPITITILWAMNPKSPGTSPRINLLSSPIQPAAYLLWDIPWSQCTHQVQSQNQLPFCKQLPLLPSASQFHLLPGHPSQTPGVLLDTHPKTTTSQSSVPRGHHPNCPQVIPFLIYPLGREVAVRHRLCQAQIARAVAVTEMAEYLQRVSRLVGEGAREMGGHVL